MNKIHALLGLAFSSAMLLSNCASNSSHLSVDTPTPPEPLVTKTYQGKASWYQIKCNGGTHTASGIPLRDYAMTAAHKTLPMGTKVRVTNTTNNKSVIVKITDRGPYTKGRIIDVTKGAAEKLGFIHRGITACKVEVIEDQPSPSLEDDSTI
ncbi:hypothetical protein NT6N_40120 [Oceaniferula spumae]|uniref:Probable endolytic peptidoglycan transglycosylase RlpA n=1 Tax=Oceaniferula spumae TaxID=2979115 RepID=A0AAT9FST0_9BACT